MIKIIQLVKGFNYDNNYSYVKMFSSKTEQLNYFNSLPQIDIDEHNYLKVNNSFNVQYELDFLENEGVNYLLFNNGYRDIFAFIISKEYISKNTTKIIYEVDVMNTFMFNYDLKKSFIERKKCLINEITDFDEGLEIGEHIIEYETSVIEKRYTFFAMFNGFRDYHIVENKASEIPFSTTNAPKTTINGITYPFVMIALEDEYINDVFKNRMINFPNLIGIIRLPHASYVKENYAIPYVKITNGTISKEYLGTQYVATNIISSKVVSTGVSIPKTEETDFFPYTYYVATDGEVEPLVMQPQYLSSSLSLSGIFSLSHLPVERYYPNYYKGSTSGRIYNITNNSNMFLPTGTNGGIETLTANLSQIEQSKKSMYANILTGVASVGIGIATGGVGLPVGLAMGANSTVNAFTTIKENMARLNDLELTPSTIKSFGTPSTRRVFGNDEVRIVKYTIKTEYKERVKKFIERYGNKYNNFEVINLKIYKGYLKVVEPDIDSTIDNLYIRKIKEILERGVFIE